ncbi:MAG: cache domain-containing protein [Bacteroidales bacterium]|nr:cache domain-containing protein [Bacteroidales bacterium]
MSIRLKLSRRLTIIVLTFSIILSVVSSLYVRNVYYKEVQTRVRLDLNSADNVYHNYIDQIDQVLKAVSIRRRILLPLEQEVNQDLGIVLNNIYEESGMDILMLVGGEGRVIYRAHNPLRNGDDISNVPIVKKVLIECKPVKGTMIVTHDMLKNENQELARRAIVKIKDTPKARSISKQIEERGMLIAAAVPFFSLDTNNTKKRLGVLIGGYLLNNHFEIVDNVKSELYQDQIYKGKDIGTATIFFDDLRISTNVLRKDNQRAIGSRMSSEVYDHVINYGKVWADRAFVVNNWYITAYEPIRDLDNNIIGSLYVGLLEEPFKKPQRIIILFFILMVAITTSALLALILFFTRKMIKPIDHINVMSKKVIDGDLSARCGIYPSGEMGVLCQTIDQMADAIERRENELQSATQQQVCQSEKLASIGRLSAGIAHEINNPLTGVLTFAHLLKQKKNNEEDIKDIETIIEETTKVREIVRGLLDFARQTPFQKEYTNINDDLHLILKLIKNQKEFRNIIFVEKYSGNIPAFYGDKNQLQQVFLNLLLNAGEAVSKNGTVTISTSIKKNKIMIAIEDNGCGIKKKNMVKIFDPFFTTKPVGKGTGLGLSISYGIIQQHDGQIECESIEGEGTTFTIFLPINQAKVKE